MFDCLFNFNARMLSLLVLKRTGKPGTSEELDLDATSAARLASAIDYGLGRALVENSDGTLRWPIAIAADRPDKASLASAWL